MSHSPQAKRKKLEEVSVLLKLEKDENKEIDRDLMSLRKYKNVKIELII
jgi:hypothetical protein